ncbi:unnamed protein product [Victoria cruziana]
MGGRNTFLLDAISCRIPLVSDIPTIIFGADVTHPKTGEESRPSIAATSTIVDSKIYHPFEFDFYLCSHAGIRALAGLLIIMFYGMRIILRLMDYSP